MIPELIIFLPNVIFQSFKYNKNKNVKIIIDQIIYSIITKYKLNKKLNESQKYIRVILIIFDWFNNKKRFLEKEIIIIIYIIKYDIIIPKFYKKIINNSKYIK